ncbi:atr, partial [Symbiodinium sp. CCMP2456]
MEVVMITRTQVVTHVLTVVMSSLYSSSSSPSVVGRGCDCGGCGGGGASRRMKSGNERRADSSRWRLLLRALETFGEVELLQELLLSAGPQPPQRAALWLSLARALRRSLNRQPEEAKRFQRSRLVRAMGDEAAASASTQWASLASALSALIAFAVLGGDEGGEEDMPMLDSVFQVSTRVKSLAALPTPLESAPNPLRRRPVFGRTRARPVAEAPREVLLLCAFCNTTESAESLRGSNPCCPRCGAELLSADLSVPHLQSLRYPAAKRGRWLRQPQDFMSLVVKLRARLVSSAPATALGLLEPGDSQPSLGRPSAEVSSLLSTAVLCLCLGCSKLGLSSLAKDLATFFPQDLDAPRIPASWEAPEPLGALLRCPDFRAALSGESATPLAKRRRGEATAPAQPLQIVALSSQQLTKMVDEACNFATSTAGGATFSASSSLQRLLSVCMLAPSCADDVFLTVDRNLYLNLLERYSRSARAASLCQLLLTGTLKSKMRLLLPKLLPVMVLHENVDSLRPLCKILDEESLPSVFTPNLPFVLFEIASLPATRAEKALSFLISGIYKGSVSAESLSAAFLGKALVLLLWESARLGDQRQERLRRTLAVLTNISQALQALQARLGPGSAALQDRKRPEPSLERSAKKRKAGEKETKVIDIAGDGGTCPEVLEILERHFLHVLDILGILLDPRSPKWQEYCDLLSDPFVRVRGDLQEEATSPDMARFCRMVSLLLELPGDHLQRFAPKVFELLQKATAQSSQHPESVDCWRHYVAAVGVARLKPLLPAVISELLRLGAQLKAKAARAFEVLGQEVLSPLIVETCRSAAEVVASLPELPAWESLRTAKAAVDKARAPDDAKSSALRLERCIHQLQAATQQVVRRSALESLHGIIQEQRQAPCAAELPKPTLARLLRALLKFLWESSSSPDDQLLCGQLLGSLGAIDPARLSGQVLVERHSSVMDSRSPKGDIDLAKTVLEEFLAPNLTSNNYAFAAQEIFRYLKPGGKDQQLLLKLEREDVRETLRPYMSSSYERVSATARAASQGPATFEDALVAASSLLPAERRAFFEACLPAIPGNHALTLFLMHQVLPDLLAGPKTDEAELSALATRLSGLLRLEEGVRLEPRHSATAQAVFSLLDDLYQRQEEVKQTPVTRNGDEMWKNRQMQRIELLLTPFAPRLVVSAAVRCGAHARALQFLEEDLIDQALQRQQNIFDTEGPRISEADCELLQKIYSELGDSDGVVGVLRIGPASARTRRPELELQGRWADVQACYELATEGPERGPALCGLVRCTQAMRRYESSLQLITGIRQEQPELAQTLRPHAVEAAWQLGSWGRLTEVLQEPSPDGPCDFQVKLGRAVLAVHERDSATLSTTLRETTLEVARAASAAARESYTRAYQHLLRLHVLSDIDWVSKYREGPNSKPGDVAKNLLARCDITTPSFSVRQTLLRPLSVLLQDLKLKEDAKTLELAFARLCRKHKEHISMEHPDTSFQGTSERLRRAAQIEWGKILYASGARTDALRHTRLWAQHDAKARLLGTRW